MKKLLLTLSLCLLVILGNSQGIALHAEVDQHISCHGNNDGYIQANVTTPVVGTYTYILKNENTLQEVTNTNGYFKPLKPGRYSVVARSMTGSSSNVVMNLQVEEPSPLTAVWTVYNYPSALDTKDGMLGIEIGGGTAVLQPHLTWWIDSWSGDTLNNVLTDNFATALEGLGYGVYQVYVEDDRGCFATFEKYFMN